MIEPTDDLVQAAQAATCGAESDECMRDALVAAFAILARERCMERRGHVWHPLARPALAVCAASGPDGLICQRRPAHGANHAASDGNGLVQW